MPAKEDRKDTTKKDIANERTSSSKSKDDSEKYVELKNKLIQQILKKQELTRKLTTLEDSIYQKEIDYFEESPLGNIVKGFENFSKLVVAVVQIRERLSIVKMITYLASVQSTI